MRARLQTINLDKEAYPDWLLLKVEGSEETLDLFSSSGLQPPVAIEIKVLIVCKGNLAIICGSHSSAKNSNTT